MNYLEVNRARRANRDYDPAYQIDRPTIEGLINEAALAPSSMNMQGTRVIVVMSPEEKKRLHAVVMNQEQVLTASAVIVVLGNLHAYKGLMHILEQSKEVPAVVLERHPGAAARAYGENLQAQRDEALRTGSFFSMNFMLAATNAGYQTCPMGGFDPAGVARDFQIHEPYFPILLISIGKGTTVPGPRGYRTPATELAQFR